MAEEATTPDLVELTRNVVEATERRDFDAVMSFYRPDSVWDMSPVGLGTYEGVAAIRDLLQDWVGAYEEFAVEFEEILDLSNGVTFAVADQSGRPVGSSGHVQLQYAWVTE